MSDANDIGPVVAPTPPPAAPAPPEKLTPILGPLLKVLGSQKFVIVLLSILAVVVLWGVGRITLEQGGYFIAVVLPAWLVAHGIQERK